MQNDLTQQFLDEDPAYQEWAETIGKQNQQQQDADMVDAGDYTVIDLSDKTWDEIESLLNATKANSSDSRSMK